MTDKPIIIDGVDVSGCENALQGKHTILCAGSEDRALCDANKNCLYKKYKRKEQECEELKQTLAEIKEIAEKEVNTRMLFADKESFCDFNKILQKINECEVENVR